MSTCKHTAWLRAIENQESQDIIIEQTDRLDRIFQELPDPSEQTPQLCSFLGGPTKDEALRHIFPQNNIGRRTERSNVNLRIDTESLNNQAPLLFADSHLSKVCALQQSHIWCHETTAYSAPWSSSSRPTMDIIYSRIVFLFSDIVCLFADDFPTLEELLLRMEAWMEIGSASPLAYDVRPRLLIVISEDGKFSNQKIEHFIATVHELSPKVLSIFCSLKVFRLAGKHLSATSRYHRLRDELRNSLDEARHIRAQSRCLFSALHFRAFLNAAVEHTSRNPSKRFDFITVSRQSNPISSVYSSYLEEFLRHTYDAKAPYKTVTSFISSAILKDAYPPGMHCLYFLPKAQYLN